MRIPHKLLTVGRPMLLGGFLIGMFMICSAPVMAADMKNLTGDVDAINLAVDCDGQAMQVASEPKARQGTGTVGACPPPNPLQTGSPPPAGAIKVNPVGSLPSDAICEAASNNACSAQGAACGIGQICKDTWNAVSHACICQCRN